MKIGTTLKKIFEPTRTPPTTSEPSRHRGGYASVFASLMKALCRAMVAQGQRRTVRGIMAVSMIIAIGIHACLRWPDTLDANIPDVSEPLRSVSYNPPFASEGHEAAGADTPQTRAQVNWRHAADRLSKVIAMAGERGSW